MKKPKGTYDVYGEYGKKVLYIENVIKTVMSNYNYEYIRTPIFEAAEVFQRGVGETTDIVSKEMYEFLDKSDRKMTLRPENTASVVRAYIENKIYGEDTKPYKCWYYGPMFRYERPQSGRFREFYQGGVEVLGVKNPMIDAEVISIPVIMYQLLGLKGIKVKINTLGDNQSRANYKEALVNYLKPNINKLCSDCQSRFDKNPLRILDCKVDSEGEILKNTPSIEDYLTEDALKYYNGIKKYLDVLGVEFEESDKLVRGLDYYTDVVFEVEADVEGFGSQNVLCGGGRYDKLVSELGGPETAGIGFAFGMERLIQALELEKIKLLDENDLDVYLIPIGEKEKDYAFSLLSFLRLSGFKADIDYMDRNLKANFKQADRYKSKFVIIVGEEELRERTVTIKDNENHTEEKIKEEFLLSYLDEKIGDELE